MKRIGMRDGALGIAAILVALALCVGCKEKEANDVEKPAAGPTPVELGKSALDSGDWTRAYDAFSDALAANPNDADAYFGRAAASCATAKEHYRLAQAAATNQDVKSGEAEAKKADEFFQKTVDDCDKALENDPNCADACFLKGVVAQYQARWNDGIDAFTQCVALDPNRAEAYHRRGEIYDNIGDYMNSEVDFKKASELGYADESADDAESAALDDFSELNYEVEGDEAETETEAAPAQEQ